MPEESGLKVKPGSLFVLQIHYYSAFAPGEFDDSSHTYLQITDKPKRIGDTLTTTNNRWLSSGDENNMKIPPGESKTFVHKENLLDRFEWAKERHDLEKLPEKMTIYSANIHMHSYGANGVSYLQKGEDKSILLEIPKWDLNWQDNFFFKEPITISRADADKYQLAIECVMENPNDYEIVGGFGSDDEMCINFSYVVFD